MIVPNIVVPWLPSAISLLFAFGDLVWPRFLLQLTVDGLALIGERASRGDRLGEMGVELRVDVEGPPTEHDLGISTGDGLDGWTWNFSHHLHKSFPYKQATMCQNHNGIGRSQQFKKNSVLVLPYYGMSMRVLHIWCLVIWKPIKLVGAMWPSLSPYTIINPILLTYLSNWFCIWVSLIWHVMRQLFERQLFASQVH